MVPWPLRFMGEEPWGESVIGIVWDIGFGLLWRGYDANYMALGMWPSRLRDLAAQWAPVVARDSAES